MSSVEMNETLPEIKLKQIAEETLNNATVLVCGGAGFIGSNFIHLILERYPKVSVVNFDALTYSGNLDNLSDIESDPRYVFVEGDIADQEMIEAVFEKYSPDFVINFAAETHVDRSIHVGAREFINTNVLGVYNLLEAVKGSKKVQNYVQVSTDEVFGSLALDSEALFTEMTAFAPNVPYAATKAGGDMLCRAYHNTWQVPVVVTHCSNNYGPNQYPEKVIPFFVQRILEGKKLPLYGDGQHVRDWIYVLDHCEALLLCLLKGTSGAVYNIGADSEMSNRDIAAIILEYFNKGDDQIEFVAERPGHDRRYAIDSSFIQKELGWTPTRHFKDAFIETIKWYVDNQEWIDKVRQKTGVFNPHIDLWAAHEVNEINEANEIVEVEEVRVGKKLKGVILAGGLGTRLAPLTRITNKHLLPVHNKPMILYPLETLKQSGIDDVMVVCGREHAGHFMNFLGSGNEYGVSISYAIQDTNNGGIADALRYAEDFADNGPVAVILGDNIFETHFAKEVREFKSGATVIFKEMENVHRFGVPVFDENNERIIHIEEKPAEPKSNYAQTGFYIYDETVFSKLKNLTPSARGEFEITDVNNMYLGDRTLSHSIIDGFWSDAGTFESLMKASNFMAERSEEVFDYSKILITGASGMLGSYVDFGLRPDSDVLNILDRESVSAYVQKHAPTAIIHLAGATDMTLTEKDPLYAYELNVRGTYNVAKAAAEAGIPMVYASTSRVFKGDRMEPYGEEDAPEPVTQYANTKYLGEMIVATHVPKHIIARTSWVFGGGPERDNKFYGNILRQLNKSEIHALNDVYGSPTYGKDYIATIKQLLAEGQTGIVHIANEGVATRYDLARHMVKHFKPNTAVIGVNREFFPSSASLPTNESMSSKRCTLRPWQEALDEYLDTEWKKEVEVKYNGYNK